MLNLELQQNSRKISTFYLVLVPMFTALTIIGGFIKIPTPIVPITLQTLFVILSGVLLGSKMGALSQLLYVALGLIGLPVFSQGGGIGYVLKPTFGYLIGFILGAYVIGKIIEMSKNKNVWTFLFANASGLFMIYTLGVSYMYFLLKYVSQTPISFSRAMEIGVLIPLPKDLILIGIVTIIASKIFKRVTEFRSGN